MLVAALVVIALAIAIIVGRLQRHPRWPIDTVADLTNEIAHLLPKGPVFKQYESAVGGECGRCGHWLLHPEEHEIGACDAVILTRAKSIVNEKYRLQAQVTNLSAKLEDAWKEIVVLRDVIHRWPR